MEDLIKTVTEKTGISPDQAKDAITAVVDHLKDKLPFGLGDKIESFISNGSTVAPDGASSADEGIFGGLKDKLSGLF